MKIFPPAGPERTRALVLIGLLVVAGGLYYWQSRGDAQGFTAAAPPMASNSAAMQTPSTGPAKPAGKPGAARPASDTPEALRLPDLEQVPDEPGAGRDPFRFGMRPAPPPPTPIVTTPPPQLPPPPPPPPMVQLKLAGVMILEPHAKNRAYLVDQSGNQFEAVEGQIVDGRYRCVKVATTSVVVSFLDGSGQRTLQVGR